MIYSNYDILHFQPGKVSNKFQVRLPKINAGDGLNSLIFHKDIF